MGKWLRNQKMTGTKNRFSVFQITKEDEQPTGKLSEGASLFYVYQDAKTGKWTGKIPKKVKNVGWIRFPVSRHRLRKVF